MHADQPLDLRFRHATPADAATLTEFMRRTFRETYSERFGGVCRDADVEHYVAGHFSEAQQRDELVDPTRRTIFAEVDGIVTASAQLRDGAESMYREAGVVGERPVEVARFYVDRPWHGRGVAGALMQHCIAQAAGADPLWLGVFERNARARAFYAKWGFVPAGRALFRLGDDVQTDWILVRPGEAAGAAAGAPRPAGR